MKNSLVFGAVLIFFLNFHIPVYAQWNLFQKNPIDLVKEELRKGVDGYSHDANDPSKWLATLKGDISIVGWKSQKTDKDETCLVSYTYNDSKDTIEKGWWWEVNTKENIVRIVLQDSDLTKKYNLADANKTMNFPSQGLLKGMSKFTVKTLYGESDENDNQPDVNTWTYYINGDNNQRLSLKIKFISDEVYEWGYYNRDQQDN